MTGFPQVILNPKMLILTFFFISLLHLLLPITAGSAYNATDLILLDCGSQSNPQSQDGRSWDADVSSRYSFFNDQNSSIPSTASHQGPSVPLVPYLSALIIKSKFTYSFPVSLGPKFLRLHFYPEKYSTFDMTASFFSVTANSYTLLKNFSAHMHLSHLTNQAFLIKEFIVNVWDNEMLNVTFIPSPTVYAFINGIEIFSMPSPLYLSGREIPLVTVVAGQSFFISLDNTTTSLEILYRLNVGGKRIESVYDTGLYRTWGEDGDYLVGLRWTQSFSDKSKLLHFTASTPAYTAPEEVYNSLRTLSDSAWLNSNNMTWKFSVDAGFHYLIRLHFCELLDIPSSEQRVFEVLINNQTADINMNVVSMSSGERFPMYKDYIVMADNRIQGRDLLLTLYPQSGANASAFFYPFLNGLEIFKVNQSNGNLAGPNPDLPHRLPVGWKSKVTSTILPIIGGFALFSLLSLFVFQRRRKLKDLLFFKSKLSTTKTSLLPSDHCRRFSIAKIKVAAKDFNDQFLIARGGFGNVYRGIIDGESTTVAIKRLNPSSRQGAHEFHTEITMLSKLRYIHLVSLIGYCDDHGEMILVYDYMPRGTLRDHLYETKNPRLSWKRRLEICIGAARGLHYLHTGWKHSIIHRDVKSSNILLDENYVAKVSDFGLSKQGPTSMSQTHVSTVVKGSFGYIDPEYYLLQQLTEKSDVYSFGVVLLEVLSGKPPVIQGLSEEKVGLAQWGRSCYQKGSLDEIVDPYLVGQIAPIALQKFGEIAENCVREHGRERPTMNDVVRALEFTLQLQETVDKSTNNSDAAATDEHSSENKVKSQSTSVDNSWEKDLSSEICISDHS